MADVVQRIPPLGKGVIASRCGFTSTSLHASLDRPWHTIKKGLAMLSQRPVMAFACR